MIGYNLSNNKLGNNMNKNNGIENVFGNLVNLMELLNNDNNPKTSNLIENNLMATLTKLQNGCGLGKDSEELTRFKILRNSFKNGLYGDRPRDFAKQISKYVLFLRNNIKTEPTYH